MIRVLLVDDHPVTLAGVRHAFTTCPDINVVAEAHDADGALHQARLTAPDVVVLDIHLPGTSGAAIIPHLHALGTAVVAFSAHAGRGYVRALYAAGAQGFITKDQPPADLADAVRAAAAGRGRWGVAPNPPGNTAAALTPREVHALSLLARGLPNADIGVALSITAASVRNVLSHAYRKIGARSAREALVWARREGFDLDAIRPDTPALSL